MIEHDKDAQAERARCKVTSVGATGDYAMRCEKAAGHDGAHVDPEHGTWEIGTVRPPVYTETELLGRMAECMEQMPEAGRIPALRYLMDRYGSVGMLSYPR